MFFQTVIVSLLVLGLGAATAFAGFRLFVVLLPLWGFFAGFIATAEAIQQLFGGGFLATISSWVVALVVGVLFAVVAYLFYYAAIVILAATVGYELGVGIMVGLTVNSGLLQFIAGLAIAIAFAVAVVALNLPKVFIIVLTALGGASMILAGILLAFGVISLPSLGLGLVGAVVQASWFWMLAYIAIAAAGMVVQSMLPDAYKVTPYGQEQASFQAPTTMPSQPFSTPSVPSEGSGSLPA